METITLQLFHHGAPAAPVDRNPAVEVTSKEAGIGNSSSCELVQEFTSSAQ